MKWEEHEREQAAARLRLSQGQGVKGMSKSTDLNGGNEISSLGGTQREKANRKRSKAMSGRPHAAKGESRGESQVSIDTAPSRERSRLAAEVQASEPTIARALALHNKRPDLAGKVRSGEMSQVAATRRMKKDELGSVVEIPGLPRLRLRFKIWCTH